MCSLVTPSPFFPAPRKHYRDCAVVLSRQCQWGESAVEAKCESRTRTHMHCAENSLDELVPPLVEGSAENPEVVAFKTPKWLCASEPQCHRSPPPSAASVRASVRGSLCGTEPRLYVRVRMRASVRVCECDV